MVYSASSRIQAREIARKRKEGSAYNTKLEESREQGYA
jgi:hypothetical protein